MKLHAVNAANAANAANASNAANAAAGAGHALPGADTEAETRAIAASFAQADGRPVDLSGYGLEDWICLGFFWLMTGLVVVQFFTRYVLNDSFAWTEELAVYCLIPVVFIGAAACVRRSRHIQVNLVYRWLPGLPGRLLATAVDVLNTAFFAYAAWLIARFALAVDNEPMTTIDWNKSHVYWLAFAGMVLMAARSLQVGVRHLRQGFSALERPEAYE
ncbi:TRAP transporter small permease [Azohydromonas aeria]|uniref:TRAP transporter small permease n=1 Tax=Azohydromonas aeria TaxID=2590212 RepID=UPI0012FCFD45|nr:TRAP transporter small permease [Azohydromonas aeria]